MKKILSLLENNPAYQALLSDKKDLVVNSINDEALLVASAFLKLDKDIVIVKANQYEANNLYRQVSKIINDSIFFPVDESFRIETLAASPELLGQRIDAMYRLINDKYHLLITHVHGLTRYVPTKKIFKDNCMKIKVGDILDVYDLQRFLINAGYLNTPRVDQPFYFSKRGGVIDVYSLNYDNPLRIEFFDDEIDLIRFYDPKTQKTIEKINEIEIIPASDILYLDSEVNHVSTSIKNLTEQQLTDLDEVYHDDLLEKIGIDLENLKQHDTTSSNYAYYNLFNETGSILDYLDNPMIILSNQDEINFQFKNYTAENFFYYRELSDIGKFLNGLNVYNDINEVIKNNYLCFKDFATKQDDIIFNSHEVLFNHNNENNVIDEIKGFLNIYQVLICLETSHQLNLMVELFESHEMKYSLVGVDDNLYPGINMYVGTIPYGIELVDEKVVVLTSQELFGHSEIKKPKYFRYKDARVIKDYQELNVGDYVVHDSYGIGQYLGIKTLEVRGCHKDYLYVAYAGEDTLYIPVEQFKLVRKYAGADGKVPKVHKLGSSQWTKAKQKARAKIDDIADKLIEIYASRMANPGFAFPEDDEMQVEFENNFGYELTVDQQRSVDEIKEDMEKDKPMDRLLCGDVGFGKTEVALRGAFKAILGNKQVAFLCPTTILSMQHYKTVVDRFTGFSVNIALLNRFTTTKQKNQILSDLKEGKIDIIIGTHRILSKDVVFKDLGLLIIDEEQRFGVRQKEKIKEYRESIDVLVLSATPIPRTLQMSLMGIRGLSQIETPPKDRIPVQTYVIEKNNVLIKQVIERELARDGQVFYLYNRTNEIANVAHNIQTTIPNAKVAIGHGQMDKDELEDVMMRFMNKEFNVLVCTTIIETGIDIPNANTIIVEDADRFGLSQLYQIRGRVGRSNRGAYAYLLYKKNKMMNDEAVKRLKAIKEFTELGSGYKIAMRDLSIRGSGDILGGKQAGFIDSIGFEMYMQILTEAINQRKGIEVKPEENIEGVNVSVDGYIPHDYVDSDYEKLELYQRLEKARKISDVVTLKSEFIDYYGKLPVQVETLIDKRRLDILANNEDIESIIDLPKDIEVTFTVEATKFISGDKLFTLTNQLFTKPKFKAVDNKIILTLPKNDGWLNHLNELLLNIPK